MDRSQQLISLHTHTHRYTISLFSLSFWYSLPCPLWYGFLLIIAVLSFPFLRKTCWCSPSRNIISGDIERRPFIFVSILLSCRIIIGARRIGVSGRLVSGKDIFQECIRCWLLGSNLLERRKVGDILYWNLCQRKMADTGVVKSDKKRTSLLAACCRLAPILRGELKRAVHLFSIGFAFPRRARRNFPFRVASFRQAKEMGDLFADRHFCALIFSLSRFFSYSLRTLLLYHCVLYRRRSLATEKVFEIDGRICTRTNVRSWMKLMVSKMNVGKHAEIIRVGSYLSWQLHTFLHFDWPLEGSDYSPDVFLAAWVSFKFFKMQKDLAG